MFFSRRKWQKTNTFTIGHSTPRRAYACIPISTHAEIDGLKQIKNTYSRTRRIQELDLIVLRISRYGNLCYSKPCYHCIKQLERASYIKIKNVYYSESGGSITSVYFKDLVNMTQLFNIFISSGYRHRMHIIQKKEKTKLQKKNINVMF